MIPRDKLLHFVMGALCVVVALGAVVILRTFGVGPTMAYATTFLGVFYEFQQWYRREGTPDGMDAAATAFPGWLAWVVLEKTQWTP